MVTTNTDLDPQYVERTAPQVILNKMTKSKFDSTTKDPDQLYAITDINASVERELTQAQYNALSNSEKNNGTTYYITDGNPSGSVESYSLTEVLTGGTWLDGRPIYKKTVNCGNLPNNAVKRVNHNISSLDLVIKVEGFAKYYDTSGTWFPVPFTSKSATTSQVQISGSETTIDITTGTDRSSAISYVTLWYVKK